MTDKRDLISYNEINIEGHFTYLSFQSFHMCLVQQ